MVNWKYIAIIIAVIAAIIITVLMVKRKGISFDFDLGGNLSSIIGMIGGRNSQSSEKLGAYITVPLTTKIKNDRRATTVLNNISGSISYNGVPVIQTNPGSSSLQSVPISGRSATSVSDNVQLLINESSIKFLTDIIEGKNPLIQYNFMATVNGKPYSFNKTSTIKKA